ncbi:ABC transporter substrate-binding protein [Ramlibacter sp. WS9]|uniref:ABC transporter substrate-binding protein n=1 Tax=Ramlibacter sp. WS9 TaxID=1882741 RepID=UPI0013053905|nr:ABC transporter substrate-binding protein [Ramlibacter sp. WS9]
MAISPMAISRRDLIISLGAASVAMPAAVLAQPPAQGAPSDREVLIGRTTPASSPFSEMARQRRTGADACIAKLNAAGGVHGRRVKIIDRDDGYQAEKASIAVKELLDQEGVFAMLGAFGTPTLPVVMARTEEAGVPLIGAGSLSNEARHPFKRHVFPVRAASVAETAHAIKHQRTLAVERFAIVSSKEAYGPAGANAFAASLQSAGLKPVETIAFSASDDARAVADRLRASGAQALLVSVLPKPFSAVLSHYRKMGGAAQVIGFSAIRIEDLVESLGPMAVGVGLSQPVPVPTRTTVPLVKAYHAALAAHDGQATPSYHGLEGYLEALVMVEGLRRAGRNLSRERLVSALESMTGHDFGGVLVKYGPNDRTGSAFVDIVMLNAKGGVVY